MEFFFILYALCSLLLSVFFGFLPYTHEMNAYASVLSIQDVQDDSIPDGKFLDVVFSNATTGDLPVVLHLETARTPPMWRRGLMFRHSLPDDDGMIFIFPDEAVRTFWMKNTLIPLDMIFLDSEKHIVKIHSGSLPCREKDDIKCPIYPSGKPAKYVIELAAGKASALHLAEGDTFLIR